MLPPRVVAHYRAMGTMGADALQQLLGAARMAALKLGMPQQMVAARMDKLLDALLAIASKVMRWLYPDVAVLSHAGPALHGVSIVWLPNRPTIMCTVQSPP